MSQRISDFINSELKILQPSWQKRFVKKYFNKEFNELFNASKIKIDLTLSDDGGFEVLFESNQDEKVHYDWDGKTIEIGDPKLNSVIEELLIEELVSSKYKRCFKNYLNETGLQIYFR